MQTNMTILLWEINFSGYFQVIWEPGKFRLKLMNWGNPPPVQISSFFYVFFLSREGFPNSQ